MAPRSSASASDSGTGNKKEKEVKRTRSAKKTAEKGHHGENGRLGKEEDGNMDDEELVVGPGLSAAQAKMTIKSKATSTLKNASAARKKGLADPTSQADQAEPRKSTKGRKKAVVNEDNFEALPTPSISSRSSSTSSPKNSRSARVETSRDIFADDMQDDDDIDIMTQMSSDNALRKSSKTKAPTPVSPSRPPQFDQDDDKDFMEFLEKKSKARTKKGGISDDFEDEEDMLDALDEEEGFFNEDEVEEEPLQASKPGSRSKRKLPVDSKAKKTTSKVDPIRSSTVAAAVAAAVAPPSVVRKGGASSISFDKYFDDDLDFNPSFRDGRVMPSRADGMESDVEYFQDDNEFDDPLESSQIVDQDDFVAPAKTRKLSGRKTMSDFVDDDIDVEQEEMDDDMEFDEDLDEDEFEDDLEEDEDDEEEEEAGFGVDEYFDDEDESDVSESDPDILDELDEEDEEITGRGLGFNDDIIIEDDSPARASSGRSRNISAYAYEDADLSDLDQAELSDGFEAKINDDDDDADMLLDGSMDEDESSSRKTASKKKKKITAAKKPKAKSPKAAPKKRGRKASSMSSDEEEFVPVLSDPNQMLRSVIKHDARVPNDLDDDEVPSLDSYNEYDAYEEQVLNDMDQLSIHRRASHVWELNDDMYVTIVDAADSNLWLDGDEENFDILRQSVRKALLSQNSRVAPEGSSQWLGTKMFEAAFDAHYTEMFAWTNDFKEPPSSICDLFPPSQPAPPRLKITTLFSDVKSLDQGDLPNQAKQPAMVNSYDEEISNDEESDFDEDEDDYEDDYLDADVGSDERDEDDHVVSAKVAASNGRVRPAPASKTKAISAKGSSNGVAKATKVTTARKTAGATRSRTRSSRAMEEDLYDEDDLEGADEYLEIEERERVRHAAATASFRVVKDKVVIKDKEAALQRINVLGSNKENLVSAVHTACKRVLKRDLNPDEVTNCIYSSRYYKLTVCIYSNEARAQAIRDGLSKSAAVKSVF
eukprot:CAMPEP_0184694032 /NCGR_PEP_ID=MMETSP0313-20130426/2102_1 /TAXON_ID=2792 /ORGANISM="Porphyridium aerugineum, Strain SAG 1380-2" /LENGTH=990 /DNA_ID=CAMNT_0027152243 /DNA_START=630 /DNA_END=3602 /DNA_ORIENTATION=-